MKLGLILEGGASRTCFSNGVMDVLMDEKIRADYIIGASAESRTVPPMLPGREAEPMRSAENIWWTRATWGRVIFSETIRVL